MKRTLTAVAVAAAFTVPLLGHAADPAKGTEFTLADFAYFDKNGDGYLTQDELSAMPEKQRKKAMASDANKDGKVSKPEVSDWVSKGPRMADPAGRDKGVQQADPAKKGPY